MAIYTYEIGTTKSNRVNVKELGKNTLIHEWSRAEPFGMSYNVFTVYRESASGKEYGDGFPATTWKFDWIHPTQLDALLDYVGDGNQSATVHIKTRLVDGTYDTFEAVMHRPKNGEEGTYSSGRWHDVLIRLTCLVAD